MVIHSKSMSHFISIVSDCLESVKLIPANFYMFKGNNRDTRESCEICSKLTMKTPERRHLRLSGVFIVNFEHIFSSISIVNFEQVNVSWGNHVSDVFRLFGKPVYRFGRPNSDAQKTFFKFSFFSNISTKNTLKQRSVIS